MNFITVFGIIAALFTTFALLPQAVKTLRTKKADNISLGTFTIQWIGNFLWLIYGLLIHDFPLIFANGVTFIFAFSIFVMKIIYR